MAAEGHILCFFMLVCVSWMFRRHSLFTLCTKRISEGNVWVTSVFTNESLSKLLHCLTFDCQHKAAYKGRGDSFFSIIYSISLFQLAFIFIFLTLLKFLFLFVFIICLFCLYLFSFFTFYFCFSNFSIST